MEPVTTDTEHDSKGRPVPRTMDERTIAEESLLRLRALSDALEAIGSNPVMRAMMPPGLLGK